MFKHYLKLAFKELLLQKFYSLIIIIGFSIGIACWIFVLIWIDDEQKSKGMNNDNLSLYRVGRESVEEVQNTAIMSGSIISNTKVVQMSKISTSREVMEVELDSIGIYHSRLMPETPLPLAPIIKRYVPEIEVSARFGFFGEKNVKYNNKTYNEWRFAYADPAIFKFYKFYFIYGNSESAFNNKMSVIITDEMAEKYFRYENPIGKELLIDNNIKLIVSGVIKKITEIYSIKCDFIAPISVIIDDSNRKDWQKDRVNTYILMKRKVELPVIVSRITDVVNHFNPSQVRPFVVMKMPLLHSYADIRQDAGLNSNSEYIAIFSAIALFIIFIACINYFNISFSIFANKAKETAIRKTFGAGRIDIITQFIIEGQILSLISMFLAIILVALFIQQFNKITLKSISLESIGYFNLFSKSIITSFVVSLVSASYPAYYYSSVLPSKVFSSNLKAGSNNVIFRQTMSYIQFTIAVSLVIASFVVNSQLNLLRNTKDCYEDNISVQISMTKNLKQNYKAFESEIKKIKDVKNFDKSNQNDIFTLKIVPVNLEVTFKSISKIWEKYEDNLSLEYLILNEDLNKEFRTQQAMGKIFLYFTYASSFITILGFFCIASFIAFQRKNEIAVRKTYGATSINIYFLIVKEFMIICFFSIITAHFMTGFTSSTWLKQFRNRLGDFNIMEYIIPTIVSIIVLILTISFHAIKASRANPAGILKHE